MDQKKMITTEDGSVTKQKEYIDSVINDYKLYKRRWIILTLFVLYTMIISVQFFQYSTINNAVTRYYQVEASQVEWTSLCCLVSYVILIVPGLWLMNKLGIRKMMLIGCGGATVAVWIKFLARDRFYMVMIGQVLMSSTAVCTYGLAAKMTAVWFGSNEISLAGTLALLGDQLGSAFGQLLPTIFVAELDKNYTVVHTAHENRTNLTANMSDLEADSVPRINEISKGMQQMHLFYSIICTFMFIITICFFKSKPISPPSGAQIVQCDKIKHMTHFASLKKICCNISYLLILCSYGLIIGALNAFLIVLSQQFEKYFPENQKYAGRVGFLIIIAGIFGAIICGRFLDKTRLFKKTIVFLAFGCFVFMALHTVVVSKKNIYIIYVTASFQGLFWVSFLTNTIQMAIEVSFPITEDITAAYMLLSVYIQTLFIVKLYGHQTRNGMYLEANIVLCVLLFVGLLILLIVPQRTNRQHAEKVAVKEKVFAVGHDSLPAPRKSGIIKGHAI